MSEMPTYKKKDFVSDQDVKWCPGCGDYSILAAIQMTMPKIGKRKEDIAFVSGIGCSSRFPYYMGTYGMHTIHGRAPGFASGVKVANPDLSVWVITGDGDGLSIGGNHTIHMIRRNIDLNVVLFNNEIYGLTKGQYSPTSEIGTVTKSSPYGSIDNPFNPAELILGAGSAFFARTIDNDLKHMQETFKLASEHKGTSYIEVLQNCVIFNDKTHQGFAAKPNRPDNTIVLKHGEPMIYGKDNEMGIMLDGLQPKVVKIGENGITEKDLLVHDEHMESPVHAQLLAGMRHPEFPVPIGVFRSIDKPCYDEQVCKQLDDVKAKYGTPTMQEVIESADIWEVK